MYFLRKLEICHSVPNTLQDERIERLCDCNSMGFGNYGTNHTLRLGGEKIDERASLPDRTKYLAAAKAR